MIAATKTLFSSSRRSRPALGLHLQGSETEASVVPSSPKPSIDKATIQLAIWVGFFTERCFGIPANPDSLRQLCHTIYRALSFIQGTSVERTRVVLKAAVYFHRLCSSVPAAVVLMTSMKSTYSSNPSLVAEVWTALIHLVVQRVIVDSLTLDPQYLASEVDIDSLAVTCNACLKVLAEDGIITSAEWLEWLHIIYNDEQKVASRPQLTVCIGTLLDEAQDTINCYFAQGSDSLVASLFHAYPEVQPTSSSEVDLDEFEEEDNYSSPSSGSDETIEADVNSPESDEEDDEIILYTPRPLAQIFGPSRGPSPTRSPTVLSLRIPSRPTSPSGYSLAPDTPVVLLDIGQILAPKVAATAAADAKSSPDGTAVGAPSKLLHSVPLPFLDDSTRVTASVPIVAPKPWTPNAPAWLF